MVSEVSAIEVASTTLRPVLAGAIAARCALKSIAPNSGASVQSAGSRPVSALSTRRISPSPGRNTSADPGAVSSACNTRSATACSNRCLPTGRSSQWGVTGKLRPSEVTTGACIRAATGAASSVADMATINRSSRNASATSRQSARPRSAFRDLSWNSSKITAPTPGRSGSSCSMRVRMPSVTTSIRVDLLTALAPRTRKPTVCPGSSPKVAAMRSAAARAARRRGSSIRMRPLVSPASSIARGTRVVLPAPGGACSTTRSWSRSASITCGITSSMGRVKAIGVVMGETQRGAKTRPAVWTFAPPGSKHGPKA